MTKVRGPKDGKIVTASFDGKDKSIFPSLRETRDLVLLSIVGNEYCQGEYLKAIVKQAVLLHQNVDGEIHAGNTTFLIADEIYWHNLKPYSLQESNIEYWKSKAVGLGDRYFLKNRDSFLDPLDINKALFVDEHGDKPVDEQIRIINEFASKQGKNFEIVRWQRWIAKDIDKKIARMIPLYQSIPGLATAVNDTVEDFVRRHSDEEQPGLWRFRSQDYICEESPAVMWLAANLNYNFVIYPGSILPSFKATKAFFVAEEHRARIVDGQSIQEECKHHTLCLHVNNSSKLVNWLEVNFLRGHEPKLGFFAHPKPTYTTTGLITSGVASDFELKISAAFSSFDVVDEQVVVNAFKGITKAILEAGKPLDAHTAEFMVTLISKLKEAGALTLHSSHCEGKTELSPTPS